MTMTGDWTTRVTGLAKVRYLGSHPAVTGQVEKLDCGFHPAGVWARHRRSDGIRIPWTQVRRMEALSQDQVESQVTVTRVVMLGALAALASKNTRHSFLEVEDGDGVWTFAVPGLSAVELGAGIRPIVARFLADRRRPSPEPVPATSSDGSLVDRLARLDEVRAAGLISQAEYDEKRSALIALL